MTELKRQRGRPRKDEYDEKGNLMPPDPEAGDADSASQDVMAEMVDQMASLQAQVKALTPAIDVPDGTWNRNYEAEPHLKVMGGVEVKHPPEFRPAPPAGVPKFVSIDGGVTDYESDQFRVHYLTDQFGNPDLEEDGSQKVRKVLIHRGAKMLGGEPVLTEDYKLWLHTKLKGGRLNSTVINEMKSGTFSGQTDRDPLPLDPQGVPVTVE